MSLFVISNMMKYFEKKKFNREKPFINSVIDEDSKSQRVGIVSAYFKSNEQSRNELENMKKVHEEYMKRLKDKYEKDKSEKDGSGDKKESKKAKGKS